MVKMVYPICDKPNNILERVIARLTFSIGFCTVCHKPTAFLRWHSNFRESGTCLFCRSRSRHRQIAQVLNRIYKADKRYESISKNDLFIYNAESNGPLHHKLRKNPQYISSEYCGDQYLPGQIVNKIRHEDLQHLSFEDERFDLIVTADIFEHIPNPYQAHAEVYRILKVGGRHVFTVPFDQALSLDDTRAVLNKSNEIEHLKEPIYHVDPMQNYEPVALVYTIFSMEMLSKLSQLKFQSNIHHLYSPISGILGNNALVFEAIKAE